MKITQAITIEMTEAEARAYVIEVAELDSLLSQVDGGNTRTGMAQIRRISTELAKRGIGFPDTG